MSRLIFCLLLAACCSASLANGAEEHEKPLDVAAMSNEQQGLADVPLASKIGLLHKNTRWSLENPNRGSAREQQLQQQQLQQSRNNHQASSENELASGISRELYSCGRAPAYKKYDKSSSYELAASSRSKYRPFEIRTPRIIGGDETNPGEFPWTVSIKLNGQPICGGSLITRSWILTAAHCVVGYNPKNLTVRLGAHRIKDPNELQVIDAPISLFIVHKQYSMPRPFSNDIALLKMAAPIEYSDFIVPICLPIEDQITTTPTAGEPAASDYLPKVMTSPHATESAVPSSPSSVSEDFDTSEGIVVSTKMSDKEISKCFKRLEQNYLNSIGLGTSSSASSGDESAPSAAPAAPIVDSVSNDIGVDQQQQQQNKKKNYLMPPMPIDLIPVKMTSQLELGASGGGGGQTPKAPATEARFPSQAADSNSLLGPMFITTNNNDDVNNESSQSNGLASDNSHLYETHTITNNNNKISFPAFSDFNNFEQAQANQHHHRQQQQQQQQQRQQAESQLFAITNNQHRESGDKSVRNLHRIGHLVTQEEGGFNFNELVLNNHHQQAGEQQATFPGFPALPWNQRKEAEPAGRRSAPAVAGAEPHGNKAIKLTSLPISKELLHEIQSVGSMQSLNLGLQQGDFVAMAEDLAVAAVPSGYAANERERVLATPGPPASPPLAYGTPRQVVRDTDLLANELNTNDLGDGEPTRYAGMTGIVVGWGWVRENDNDVEAASPGGAGGQRSYQSVTLQKVRLPILRNSDCEAWFRSQEKKITLLPSQFCAGYNLGGKDACRGDSGGPMIIEDNSDTGRYKLIGIVSAGIGCARPSLPGLYTRVASFLPWIHAQMQNH